MFKKVIKKISSYNLYKIHHRKKTYLGFLNLRIASKVKKKNLSERLIQNS